MTLRYNQKSSVKFKYFRDIWNDQLEDTVNKFFEDHPSVEMIAFSHESLNGLGHAYLFYTDGAESGSQKKIL